LQCGSETVVVDAGQWHSYTLANCLVLHCVYREGGIYERIGLVRPPRETRLRRLVWGEGDSAKRNDAGLMVVSKERCVKAPTHRGMPSSKGSATRGMIGEPPRSAFS
jgi:hypothetical protein